MNPTTSQATHKSELPQVLIVGAGPTGLVLALWLTRFGIKVRIVDKAKGPGTTSRALVVHARTLELYQQMGLANEVIASGLKFMAINLWVKGQKVSQIRLGAIGEGLSPFPHLLIFPQDEHELLLLKHLRALGIEVEYETELIDYTQNEMVIARIKNAKGVVELCTVDYLAGCDGAHSSVREHAGVSFSGSTYSHVFYVADVKATGPIVNKELHVALDSADFLAAFPLKGEHRVRLIGTIDESTKKKIERKQTHDLTWADVSRRSLSQIGITVDKLKWFSTYHVHHRVAEHFRDRRIFLLGDAAHIHSPVGGQGMNTGIGDAVNLAWKMAAVLKQNFTEDLLDTYELERIDFARQLVATTDRAFTLVVSDTPRARFIRLKVVPKILPALFQYRFIQRFMFRTISQIAIRYRSSPISSGRLGEIHGGDRLPWVDDNFSALKSMNWQVHIYGKPSQELSRVCDKLEIEIHAFSWCQAYARAGFQKNAIYLLRPDGYIGLAAKGAATSELETYFERFKLGSTVEKKNFSIFENMRT